MITVPTPINTKMRLKARGCAVVSGIAGEGKGMEGGEGNIEEENTIEAVIVAFVGTANIFTA
jgi:hypothetical protein